MPRRCSFCGKAKSDVGRLIDAPGVYICNECVGLCDEFLEEGHRPTT
jgi:ATP-dependent Clp protease ATP-binding subunit ClpX